MFAKNKSNNKRLNAKIMYNVRPARWYLNAFYRNRAKAKTQSSNAVSVLKNSFHKSSPFLRTFKLHIHEYHLKTFSIVSILFEDVFTNLQLKTISNNFHIF